MGHGSLMTRSPLCASNNSTPSRRMPCVRRSRATPTPVSSSGYRRNRKTWGCGITSSRACRLCFQRTPPWATLAGPSEQRQQRGIPRFMRLSRRALSTPRFPLALPAPPRPTAKDEVPPMSVEVIVPSLGESIVEATVGRWLKSEGDSVAIGDPLVELETDKVNMEVTASAAGTLQRILRRVGETVSIGEPLAVISNGDEVAPPPANPAPQRVLSDHSERVAAPVEQIN